MLFGIFVNFVVLTKQKELLTRNGVLPMAAMKQRKTWFPVILPSDFFKFSWLNSRAENEPPRTTSKFPSRMMKNLSPTSGRPMVMVWNWDTQKISMVFLLGKGMINPLGFFLVPYFQTNPSSYAKSGHCKPIFVSGHIYWMRPARNVICIYIHTHCTKLVFGFF